MRVRTLRSVSMVAAAALVTGLGALAGCGSQQASGGNQQASRGAGGDAQTLSHRARKVAAAWDGSAASADWRVGYHPIGDVVQLPSGGLRTEADEQAYRDRNFVLRGKLPVTWPKNGKVTWATGGSLTRPLVGADDSYRSHADGHLEGEPYLTVSGAKLGSMRVATNRGPATVPAWLFTLEGYDSPLRQAAVIASKLPRPPIKRALNVPGLPLRGLVRISVDGRSVTVTALHGSCDEGPIVTALETPSAVVLSPSVKNRDKSGLCTKQATTRSVTVKLDRPVGDRVLLDALTGKPVPYKPLYRASPSWS
ncbi:hypothetical protein [Streptomyces boninensis]|uniref:hypothetical protein n=1 Tax=Streptomyces boninensis TaxID=2039455 RepID=UPI003B20E548